ncbi:hypothetical protein BDV95DRAFT_629711 [Massariosphaeria phaeospora]|uniref:proline--tRNA ligase n=1 Tax=Massariosphaeria phaeospora TaxID=100035 RepID=A0A7C8IB93_9PLEO|nr:hypothetical protein BDV95DRAFT_629711 [Massariosphaeria phaeospora]
MTTARRWRGTHPTRLFRNTRFLAPDARNRLSRYWAPTGGISPQDGEDDDSHALLVRGGFLRQAHSGVFHLLPLGLRVQNKLEGLIDKHMQSLGASKLSLSSITTEALWRQSGRYSENSELLRLNDRKESGFLLSPTHEEEITSLVSGMVHSYKDLPLRLYQIGRKYRDERRPRQGLLRAKEFLMKDLYTFDYSHDHALETYKSVRQAYNNFFNELKLPYVVADADSGNMGGKLSHEYHFVSPKGEDNIWSCSSCDYVANEELVEMWDTVHSEESLDPRDCSEFLGITTDRKALVHIYVPFCKDAEPHQISIYVNCHALKNLGIDIDSGIEPSTLQALAPQATNPPLYVYDSRIKIPPALSNQPTHLHAGNLSPIHAGDSCPRCATGKLAVQRAIEIGHTFHLGTRYSEPLNAHVPVPNQKEKQALQMGCHGIGVSRLIGAVASLLADDRGLNWPRVIAPFEVLVVTTPQIAEEDGEEVYDVLRDARLGNGNGNGNGNGEAEQKMDLMLDDRPIKSYGWKLRDADLIGYPVIVVLGRGWKESRKVEVQCRRLGVKNDVGMDELAVEVARLLEQL